MNFAGERYNLTDFFLDSPRYDQISSAGTIESALNEANKVRNEANTAEAVMRKEVQDNATDAQVDLIGLRGREAGNSAIFSGFTRGVQNAAPMLASAVRSNRSQNKKKDTNIYGFDLNQNFFS